MPTNNSINTPKPIDVSSGGTGLSTATTAYGVLAAGVTATSAFQNIGTGASGEVLTSNGAGALPSFQAAAGGGGALIQQVRAAKSGYQHITTILPLDDTIPQNTEGEEVLTVTITPTNVNSVLVIEAKVFGTCFRPQGVMAIFQDSNVNAIFATGAQNDANAPSEYVLKAFMTAGTTSATTFKMRVGPADGPFPNYYVNGPNGGPAFFGGGTIPNTTLFVSEFSS